MNPTLSNISEEADLYKFTLSGINVSLANAIRRTILSDIPTLAFYTEDYKDNQCNISVNTSRLHNEILKHRLSCIPIHEKDLSVLPGNYVLELDMQNETENMIIVTTVMSMMLIITMITSMSIISTIMRSTRMMMMTMTIFV